MPLSRRTAYVEETRRKGSEALLNAAERLVAEGTPYGELSIEQLAKAAGFSRATFYAYFPDKRALAMALGGRLVAEIHVLADTWFDGQGEIRDTLAIVLATFREHVGTLRTIVEGATYDEEIAGFWRALHDDFAGRVQARLEDAGVPTETAAARAFTLIWSLEGTVVAHLEQPRVSDHALLDAMATSWLAAMRT